MASGPTYGWTRAVKLSLRQALKVEATNALLYSQHSRQELAGQSHAHSKTVPSYLYCVRPFAASGRRYQVYQVLSLHYYSHLVTFTTVPAGTRLSLQPHVTFAYLMVLAPRKGRGNKLQIATPPRYFSGSVVVPRTSRRASQRKHFHFNPKPTPGTAE